MTSNPHLGIFDMHYTDKEIVEELLAGVEQSLGAQPRRTIPVGTNLTVLGQPVTHVTFILEGTVALIHDSFTAAGDVVLHEASTGRVIGLVSAPEGGNANNTARSAGHITWG